MTSEYRNYDTSNYCSSKINDECGDWNITLAEIPYPFIVCTAFQESYQMVSKEKEQLQTVLDTTKRMSMAKDQQISMLQQKGKWNKDGVCVCVCVCD